MNPQTLGCLLVYLTCCIIINADTKSEDYTQEVKHYQKTLMALHEKIDSVVNLEWRMSKLEATIEENRGNDEQTQTLIDVADYYDGQQYSDKKESLASINKTVIDALKKVENMLTNVEQVENQVSELDKQVSSFEEWKEKTNFEEQAEEVKQMGKQMEDFDATQQELNIVTRQLQNETHDLREDVSNVNAWVRRMKEDFQNAFETIRANLSEIWKESQNNASDKTVVDIVESDTT